MDASMPGIRARVLATAATALAVASPLVLAQQAFRSRVDLVRLPVVVRARNGDLVRGLKAEDFEVLEDGKPQRVEFFTEGATGAPLPLHLGLMLDTSGSMERDLQMASSAAIKFVNALDEAVDVTLVDFDTGVRVGRFSPSDYLRLFERIRAQEADGGTALYDALALYIRGALEEDGQHVLVMYTDGGDSTSTLSFAKLEQFLRLGGVMVYAVGYLEHQSSQFRMLQQLRVTQIAQETGGQAFFPNSPGELDEIYAKILDEIVSRYTVGYVSSNATLDGRFRKVQVRLTRPDLKGARVRTRPGYTALGTPGG
jgi:Ca-activated chloride channel homolog